MAGTTTSDRSQDRRKLIAVLHMDMVGYSRLIGFDDAGTLRRLRAIRDSLIDPAIEEHGGTLVQTAGDSLLIVFGSVDGAVRCAVKVQEGLPALDADQPPDRAIRFRIGINIGDAIADGTDLHGEAINVAARLQAECPPGGICVSRSVRDHVHGRLGLEFDELGSLELKNIARPVEAFVLRRNAAVTAPGYSERPSGADKHERLLLSDKPSIAVLPFANMSGDIDQEYFADGIANDIITELSRIRSFFIIARTSSFAYKKQTIDVKQVAQDLSVRYLVEGSVRRSGERVRITAQLIDAETSKHIWAERYDRDIGDIFAIQDEITLAVTKAIRPAVAGAEQRRALRKPPEKLSAWEAYQRGLWHLSLEQEDLPHARRFLKQAIEIDPTLAPAYTAMASLYTIEAGTFGLLPFEEAALLAAEQARKAVAIDPNDADAHGLLAFVLNNCGEVKSALEHIEQALSISPSCAFAHEAKGTILLFNKEPREARASLSMALELDPRTFQYARTQIGVSFYFEHDYESAVEVLRGMIVDNPKNPMTYRCLAAALGQLGRRDEASEALKAAMERWTESFNRYTQRCPPWQRPDDFEHMLDGLRKAGWQG